MSIIGLSDSKQKSTQQSQVASTYGWQSNPGSADIDTLRNTKFQVDPTIGSRLGEKERQLKDTFTNPAGGYTTPAIRDAIMRSGQRSLQQEAGQEARAGQYDVNRLNYGRNAAVAGMTAPTLTQTGSSSTGSGTVSQGQSPYGTIVKTAAEVAPLSL